MKISTPVALFCWYVLVILVVSLVFGILDVFL
jgi:hypothetical protein